MDPSLSPGLCIDRSAPTVRTVLGDRSWVEMTSGFIPDAAAHLQSALDNTPWRQSEMLRFDHYVPERRLMAGLRSDADAMLRQSELHLESRHRVRFSGVAAILYRDGDDFQGLHSDREMRWLDDTLIAIVVLGARRPFVIRRRAPWLDAIADRVPAGEHPDDLVLMPGEGDLLVMGGACQREWLHGVPATRSSEPRISLTWRWSSRRGKPDTGPSYVDGSHFSDSPRQPSRRSRRV
ncbi:MAG: alpha-ketoglutarate-dependent dioxygenase AlkB [Acidimicrobiia bacterium]